MAGLAFGEREALGGRAPLLPVPPQGLPHSPWFKRALCQPAPPPRAALGPQVWGLL